MLELWMLSRPEIRSSLLVFIKKPTSIDDCIDYLIREHKIKYKSLPKMRKLRSLVSQELATMNRLDLISRVRHGIYTKC